MAYAGSDVGGKDECPKSKGKEKEEWNSLQNSVEPETDRTPFQPRVI